MKAYVAMSGGVDSTVAAYLMKKNGYDITGATMKLHNDEKFSCGGMKDVEDARKVCDILGVPFKEFEYTDEFKKTIVDDFVMTYQKGWTPNPCVRCNKYLKFDKLLNAAIEDGMEKIATGHYAIVEEKNERFYLKKGKDSSKDQSYYLYRLTQEQLSHVVFPLGEFLKDEVREIAKQQGFENHNKHDSQDICFVPDGDYAKFIESYVNKKFEQGNFIDENGKILGKHKGIIHYTIGQRKGLGLSSTAPLFVTDIDLVNNTVSVSHGEGLFSKVLYADNVNLISIDKIDGELLCKARVRYRHVEQEAKVTMIDNDKIKVEFLEPVRAITKGQAVVLYDNDTVIGGATIYEVEK